MCQFNMHYRFSSRNINTYMFYMYNFSLFLTFHLFPLNILFFRFADWFKRSKMTKNWCQSSKTNETFWIFPVRKKLFSVVSLKINLNTHGRVARCLAARVRPKPNHANDQPRTVRLVNGVYFLWPRWWTIESVFSHIKAGKFRKLFWNFFAPP